METIILEIAAALKAGRPFGLEELVRLLHAHNKPLGQSRQFYTKKKLLPYYLKTKQDNPEQWKSWNIDEETEKKLIQLLQIKPRRTSSGVATITLITKPWPCAGDCIYCPNDIRMPKSYLSNEPACQRAERNFFDPYLQVATRLHALREMGHATDKVEIIVLGGTWSDYPIAYQTWFMTETFRALNEGEGNTQRQADLREQYLAAGLTTDEDELAARAAAEQQRINAGESTYAAAFARFYGAGSQSPWLALSPAQTATDEELAEQQRLNETATHRCVGLVIETRPDAITPQALTRWRRFGCTKIQMGIQSLDDRVLAQNNRNIDSATIARAIALTRLHGFKLHTHFMVNLYGSNPEADKADYQRFVTDQAFLPDEVKIYPCVLVEGTKLHDLYQRGEWNAYPEETLVDILVSDIANTPPYTRVSRMIRDISSTDIIAGNKKTNLRQLVEIQAEQTGTQIDEMRYREIKGKQTSLDELELQVFPYETTYTDEYFLQWVTSANEIAGFLRLSLPRQNAFDEFDASLPTQPGEAMIREVHVYGRAARVGAGAQNAQHQGLGRRLIEEACHIAAQKGYIKVNVISAVGTRAYYRGLGFTDGALYQAIDPRADAADPANA